MGLFFIAASPDVAFQSGCGRQVFVSVFLYPHPDTVESVTAVALLAIPANLFFSVVV